MILTHAPTLRYTCTNVNVARADARGKEYATPRAKTAVRECADGGASWMWVSGALMDPGTGRCLDDEVFGSSMYPT